MQRAREAWGVARAGNRIRDNVLTAAQQLVRSGNLACEDGFYRAAGETFGTARTPQVGETARKVTLIAPGERQLALSELAAECPGMSQDELIRLACEFFGWRRTVRTSVPPWRATSRSCTGRADSRAGRTASVLWAEVPPSG